MSNTFRNARITLALANGGCASADPSPHAAQAPTHDVERDVRLRAIRLVGPRFIEVRERTGPGPRASN